MGDVARASGAEKPRFDTRARASSSMLASLQHQGGGAYLQALELCLFLSIDEDEYMDDLGDEKDREGYKCDDENNDNDDYVDL